VRKKKPTARQTAGSAAQSRDRKNSVSENTCQKTNNIAGFGAAYRRVRRPSHARQDKILPNN
jgi:hypothetical protein